MLLSCMRAELMKLKRSFIWVVFLLLPIISTVMGCANYLQNVEILDSLWYSLWTQTTLFYSNFFYGPLIAVYCAYLWRVENFNHNRNALMTAPIQVPVLYLSQFLAIGCVTLLTQLWVGALYFISGRAVGMTGFPPPETFIWLLRGCVGGLAIAALQLLLSSVIRSFALPIAIALLGSIGGLLFSAKDLGLFFSFFLMLLGMNSNREEDILSSSPLPFLLSCTIFLTLFVLLGIGYLKKADVKA